MIRYLPILLLALTSAAHAQVFRCLDEAGGVLFSDRSCAEGESLNIELYQQGADAPQGLRPGELELLERMQSREPVPTRSAPSTDVGGCPGIRILAFNAYSVERVEVEFDEWTGFVYRQRVLRQCAGFELTLTGYFGRLRDSVADDLRARLLALTADGLVSEASMTSSSSDCAIRR